ncbi:hypothetical protein [Limnovirga soli]|uniref:RES domain-containing protein n=1 Tax=Limnovirga soli TaxID=2656915 RepID=A0A8J8F9A7_9BACT|nr:hypothetical protein [Limnovirga soli]NNV53880.1 hypothetical protein [Limnovirga soli]
MRKTSRSPLLEIPYMSAFDIPVIFNDSVKVSYIYQLKKKYASIRSFLKECPDDYFAPSIKKNVEVQVRNVQESMLKVIEEYLNGHPSNAYKLFEKSILQYDLEEEMQTFQQIQIPSNSVSFRIKPDWDPSPAMKRIKSGMFKYKKPLDLFHPQFQHRRSVGTNRFSISGYPSLYLSKSIHTSFSECFPDSEFGGFHVIGFKNIRPLYLLDLSKDNLIETPLLFKPILPYIKATTFAIDKSVSDITQYLGVYQLIIACHTKINYIPLYKNEKYYFKAEYIIPQLLLQWVKLKGLVIDGIRYKSCTGFSKFPLNTNHYNYVLPVKQSLEKGFCPSLASIFTSTEVYSCINSESILDINLALEEISSKIISSTFTPLVES